MFPLEVYVLVIVVVPLIFDLDRLLRSPGFPEAGMEGIPTVRVGSRQCRHCICIRRVRPRRGDAS